MEDDGSSDFGWVSRSAELNNAGFFLLFDKLRAE
jgi:hypothetical protein